MTPLSSFTAGEGHDSYLERSLLKCLSIIITRFIVMPSNWIFAMILVVSVWCRPVASVMTRPINSRRRRTIKLSFLEGCWLFFWGCDARKDTGICQILFCQSAIWMAVMVGHLLFCQSAIWMAVIVGLKCPPRSVICWVTLSLICGGAEVLSPYVDEDVRHSSHHHVSPSSWKMSKISGNRAMWSSDRLSDQGRGC